ncbi:MAG: transcription antitermination factor NusB [Dehalococcoidia bacterium]
MTAAGSRRRARTLALQALFEADTSRHLPEEAVERLAAERPEPETVAVFARELVEGVQARRAEIDALIAETAPQFPVQDLAAVDRNVLRIAIFEVLFARETPVRVAVNEAVELAKTFGSESSPRFVNGVLGAIAARASR